MKAKEQAMVTGMQSINGLMFMSTHKAAIIGIKTEAVEVLEHTPVIKEIIRAAKNGKSVTLTPLM